MGFLEEVKRQQANEREAKHSSATTRAAGPAANVAANVQPGIAILRDGLSAFAKRLSVAMPDVQARYAIQNHGELTGLRQSNYRFGCEPDGTLRFSFECRSREGVKFETTKRETCDELLNELLHCGLKVTYRSHADWRFIFTVMGFVPVEICFLPSAEEPTVRLTTKNLEQLGQRFERIDVNRIDEQFLIHLEKCILRETNEFRRLCGNELDEETRSRLQERIAARRQKRSTENTPAPEPAPSHGLRSFFSKFSGKR